MLYGSLSLLLFSVLSAARACTSAPSPATGCRCSTWAVMGSTLAFWFYFPPGAVAGRGQAAMVSVIVR